MATVKRRRATEARAAEAPPSRTPLTRERLVRAAVALADEGGLDALRMRSLADQLGVVAMATYKHFANKDELLDAMVDSVFAELALSSEGSWKTVLRDRATGMRSALLRHPWAIGLMESRAPGPASLRHHEATMACLRERAGLPFRTAVHAYSVMDSYIYGFALQQKTSPFQTPEESGRAAAKSLEAVARDTADPYPYLSEVARELGESGYDYDAEFEYGLDLILDAIERRRK